MPRLAVLGQLRRDLRTARERDPAARSNLEVALCYPGVHALWAYRVNHWLWTNGLPLPARFGATVARTLTGVEIHPAARVGDGVFIDHATGVVVGETAEIGNDVTIYHGVTLGGTSLEPTKRHPTIGDRVVIGAGAKVLGPFTVGADSRIGANAVVVREVPAGSVVVGVPGQVITRSRPRRPLRDGDNLPDPLGLSLQSLLTRVDRLEAAAAVGAGAGAGVDGESAGGAGVDGDGSGGANGVGGSGSGTRGRGRPARAGGGPGIGRAAGVGGRGGGATSTAGTPVTIRPPKGGVWQGEDFAI
ncbi:Serine acetyltransferase [Frankia sp. AiPs1]|uniref:serine O-acetyltransferase n=1 Tax=Frankia sp. AiPa1 TaxID=573492 RepID=UPI00202B6E34|nr:serine O-acetyltransferase [Frankia sp. AiPa1]MCL9762631.1 serine O-acetyltransferase [Frankia sp. AiPa1]